MRAPKRPHTTAEIRRQIAEFKSSNPHFPNIMVARCFDVHQNTVTAALRENGHRVRETRPAKTDVN